MGSMPAIILVQNASLLLAVALLADTFIEKWCSATSLPGRFVAGVFLGAAGVCLLSLSWAMRPGLIFDANSILLSIAGLLTGVVPTLVGAAITILYRLYLGSMSAWTVVAILVMASAIGILWRTIRHNELTATSWKELLLFGFAVHATSLLLMFTLPLGLGFDVFKEYALPLLLIYPGATMLLGLFMIRRIRRTKLDQDMRESEERFRALYGAVVDPVLVADADTGIIVDCNEAAETFFGRARDAILGHHQREMHPTQLLEKNGKTKSFKRASTSLRRAHDVKVERIDGETRLAHVQSCVFPLGGRRLVLGLFHDITENKRTEEDLRKSQERYQLLTDNMRDTIWALDASLNFNYLSPSIELLLGYTPEEIAAIPQSEFITQAQYDKFIAHLEMLRQSPDPGSVMSEVQFRHKSGKNIWAEYIATSVADENGNFAGIVGVSRDISERKEFEEELKKKESKYREIFERAPVGIFQTDSSGKVHHINPEMAKILGVDSPEEAIRHYIDMPSTLYVDAERRKECLRLLQKDGYVENFEYEARHVSGKHIWLSMNARTRNSQGLEPFLIDGFTTDITARKIAQQELEQETNRRKMLMDNSSDGILIISQEHRIIESNKQFAKMLGYTSPEEILGMHTWDYVADMTKEDITNFFPDLSKTRIYVEGQHRRKDGTLFDVEVSLSGIAIQEENVVLAIVRDITKRKQMQADLMLAKENAEAASSAKTEFLANMSHEIRTPINGILGMLQLLRTSKISKQQDEYVMAAANSARRLTRLLTDILDLSRIEANRITIEMEPFDVREAVENVFALFHTAAGQANLQLVFKDDPGLPQRVMGDQVRLQQVLNNLVGNAIKFTKSGQITVAAQALSVNEHDACRILFSVTDTGIGIPEEMQKKLFEPFVQAAVGYTRDVQGAGLGLSISKRLVELMGGTLSLESTVGEGTSIHFCLPFRVLQPAPLPTISSPPLTGRHGVLKILFAEDDELNRVSTMGLLQKYGYNVHAVKDGQQSIDALRTDDYDVVLMDVQMPVMDGIEATKCIRAGEAGDNVANIPIIAVTAYAMMGDEEKFLAAGMTGYIAKPIEIEKLIDTIEKLCSK